MEELLHIPQMLLIGSSGRNSGKTTLAIAMIQQWKNSFPIVGLKVTTIQERDGKCPRGGEGCGVCSSVKGNFEIVEETNPNVNKDTSFLLAAGAEKVYWLKTLKTHIYDGIKYFMTKTPPHTLIICESNSLRNVVRPGCFIMLKNTGNVPIKKSASEVMHKADLIIDNNFKNNIHTIIEKIKIDKIQSDLAVTIKEA
ncbi:MAG: hypothetical protein JG777_1510 [Clostridia bacterium]|jgi:hypothetical protein|nr:hypothetical protein [Clostridia bacterium]